MVGPGRIGPWDIIHGLLLRVPRAPHWVNPALPRKEIHAATAVFRTYIF